MAQKKGQKDRKKGGLWWSRDRKRKRGQVTFVEIWPAVWGKTEPVFANHVGHFLHGLNAGTLSRCESGQKKREKVVI